jgi:nanoRNase/pAp phosphatase (c-di-AMP/oligoRNAs hydrolase)
MASRKQKVVKMIERLRSCDRVWIATHDNPDPDGLASAFALRYLLRYGENGEVKVPVDISTSGIIGRAENRALFNYLNLRITPIGELTPEENAAVVLVDTQPKRANNSVPDWVVPLAIIDHHQDWGTSKKVPFKDIRPNYGATSTILTEYLRASGLSLDRKMATILFYGIASETQELGRELTPADMRAHKYLFPLIDPTRLTRIERARVPRDYFRVFRLAIERGRIHGPLVISWMGPLEYPDMVAEVADFLMRLDETNISICLGRFKDAIYISFRTLDKELNASDLMQKALKGIGSGGGHEGMAGGKALLDSFPKGTITEKAALLKNRFLEVLKLPEGEGERMFGKTDQPCADQG